MAIEIGTKQKCRYCDRPIIYRRPLDKEGQESEMFYRPYWFHDDERSDWGDDQQGTRWGTARLTCRRASGIRDGLEPNAEPAGICNYDLNTDSGGKCGRKIPRDNLDEKIYACGIHARYEREQQAQAVARAIHDEKTIAEGDLRAWARQNIGLKVATIIEAGLAVKWESGEKEGTYGREKDPAFVVTANIDDLLEWINAHSG